MEKAKDRVEIVEGILQKSGIPYDRIVRSGVASLYIPSVEKCEWSVLACDGDAFPPIRTCRRKWIGSDYASHQDPAEAGQLIALWYRENRRNAAL